MVSKQQAHSLPARVPALDVDLVRHEFKMTRTHTGRAIAQVVERQTHTVSAAGRDRAMLELVSNPVSQPGILIAVLEPAIALDAVPQPKPTRAKFRLQHRERTITINLDPEPLSRTANRRTAPRTIGHVEPSIEVGPCPRTVARRGGALTLCSATDNGRVN